MRRKCMQHEEQNLSGYSRGSTQPFILPQAHPQMPGSAGASTLSSCPAAAARQLADKVKPSWSPWTNCTGNMRHVKNIETASDKSVRIRICEV